MPHIVKSTIIDAPTGMSGNEIQVGFVTDNPNKARELGKQKAAAIVEVALEKGGSFLEALGRLEKELTDEKALLSSLPSVTLDAQGTVKVRGGSAGWTRAVAIIDA